MVIKNRHETLRGVMLESSSLSEFELCAGFLTEISTIDVLRVFIDVNVAFRSSSAFLILAESARQASRRTVMGSIVDLLVFPGQTPGFLIFGTHQVFFFVEWAEVCKCYWLMF